jgi:mono/diheme cytochrome c family protein
VRFGLALVLSCLFAVAAHGKDEIELFLEGRSLFQKNCAICHGATGRGNGPWAAEMTVKPRNFRSGLFKFRTTPYGKLPVDEDLARTIRNGISGTAMPAFTQLRDDETRALISYLRQLSHSWREPDLIVDPLPMPPPPPWFATAPSRAPHVAQGAQRFATYCVHCHGPTAHGDGPASLNLFDAWGQPIRPANLKSEHHKSGDGPRDLYRSIATGLNGTPMPGFVPGLQPEEIWELVAFLTISPYIGLRS